MDKVSEYIKEARIAKGVTIEEVAEATLLSPSIIKDIENGRFDKFSGDELYVKMYIRKIARYLEIDESIADDYYIKTREIRLADIQQNEEQNHSELGSTTFVDKVSESFKNIQGGPTVSKSRSKRVYEDHYIKRYIKYGIVAVIIIAIIVIVGYTFIFTRPNDSSFDNNDKTTIEGTVEKKEDTKETTDTNDKKDEKDDTKQVASTNIEFTKNTDGDFSFKLPEGYQGKTFKLKVELTFTTTANLHVNGDPNTYEGFQKGIYCRDLSNISASQALQDDSQCETIELEFNVDDFQYLEFNYSWNLGHRYYINDQKIPLEESDHNSPSNGLKTFKLTMVK